MFSEPISLRRLAEWIEADLEGDPSVEVSSLAALDESGPGAVTFAADAKNEARLADCRAAAAIVSRDAPPVEGMALLRVDEVQLAVGKLLGHLADPEDLPPEGVAPSAVVAAGASIDPTAAIGPNVTIAAGASVGAGTAVCAGAVLARGVTVGEKCMLAEGVVVRYSSLFVVVQTDGGKVVLPCRRLLEEPVRLDELPDGASGGSEAPETPGADPDDPVPP